MKKSDKKRMIYDAMALRLAVSLESFIDGHHRLLPIDVQRTANESGVMSIYKKMKDLSPSFGKQSIKIYKKVDEIWKQRNKVVHSDNRISPFSNRGKECRPCFSFNDFESFRNDCSELDNMLAQTEIDRSSMRQIMFHSLAYDMGNAGDLLKHGALALTVRWWCKHYGKSTHLLRFADPFGGCPWEEVENETIKRRLKDLDNNFVSGCVLHRKYYYNSGHVVARAVDKTAGKVRASILTSDKKDIARSDLNASKWQASKLGASFGLLKKYEYPDFDYENGYSILGYAKEFDLILIDPYGDFLASEYKQLDKIYDIVQENHDVVIMVFVLDMYTEKYRENQHNKSHGVRYVHERYCAIKNKFRQCAFSLRCPAICDGEVEGEGKYDSEILIISKQFEINPNATAELRANLRNFKESATKVLPVEIEFWPTKE